MTSDLGTWLRGQREARGWSRAEMARGLLTAAREAGERSMPDIDTVAGYVARWERGQVDISERHRLNICRVFGITISQFGLGTEPARETVEADPAPLQAKEYGVSSCGHVTYRGMEEPAITQAAVGQEVLMAAHEGSEHAEQAERGDFGDATLGQLHADVVRLSAELMTGEPFALFLEMRRVRDRVYRLLDGHPRLRDRADLYFLLACLSDLMAVPAADLGYPHAAEELLRAGWAYASAIDHRPLLAHLRLQMTGVIWEARPRQARDLAEDGLRYQPHGPNAAFLHVRYARAAARLGDAGAARDAIALAHQAREREHSDDLLAIGGEFSLSAASQHYFAGSALIDIEDGERDAAQEIGQAVRLYDAGPGPGEQHGFGIRSLARIDLAAIQLRAGALDTAAATLAPVLAMPPRQRIVPVTDQVRHVRAELAAPIFRGSPQAREFDEQIEEFSRDSVTAGLHALPGAMT